MPKPIKKKSIKKTTTEMEVKGFISKVKGSITEKKNVFLAASLGLVITIGAIAGLLIYKNTTKNNAEKLEYNAYKTYYGLYQQQPVSKEDRYTKALELYKKAYAVRKSPVSLYYIANCYYEMGKYEQAMNALKELNQRFPDDERFVPLSYYKMAMISLKNGNNDEALKSLDVLYKYKSDSYKDASLIEAGRILDSIGRADEAKKKYEELTKSFPQSPFLEEAQARLGEKKVGLPEKN